MYITCTQIFSDIFTC